MVYSKRTKFEIKIIDDNGNEMQEFFPKENSKLPYVCGEEGKSFKIKMFAVDNKKKTYATKLYIDGFKVHGLKTFRKWGTYMGFKLGGGVYKKFTFSLPTYEDETEKSDNQEVHIGKIRIKFFNTKRIKSNRPNKKNSEYKPHKSRGLPCNKKLYTKSLQVKEGEIFDNGHIVKRKNNLNMECEYDYIMDEFDMIDEVTIYYADYFSLVCQGMISSTNPNHIRYIPWSKNNFDIELCENALYGVANKIKCLDDNSVDLRVLEENFKRYALIDLKEFYNINKNINNISDLIDTKFSSKIYTNEDKTIAYVKDVKNKFNSEYIVTSHILSKNENDLLQKRKQERIFEKSNRNSDDLVKPLIEKLSFSDKVVIDLTLD